MAKCHWCCQDMMRVAGCTENIKIEFPDGTIAASIPYGEKGAGGLFKKCHDCNVKLGQKHHPGCDGEDCPKCGGQMISCECLDQEN